jgi:hypothetical protein
MLLSRHPTINELLGDSLVQAVMRADHVQPQALRTVLADAANRVAAARLEREPRSGSGLYASPRIDSRETPRSPSRMPPIRRQPLADRCASAFCC